MIRRDIDFIDVHEALIVERKEIRCDRVAARVAAAPALVYLNCEHVAPYLHR